MKSIMHSLLLLVLACSFTGCIRFRIAPQPRDLVHSDVPKLNVRETVSIFNAAPATGSQRIKLVFYGDLRQFTETCVDTVRKALAAQSIRVTSDASKSLHLSIVDVLIKDGHPWRVTTRLQVRTGDGLVREFTSYQNYVAGPGSTPATEQALAKCVVQLLNDAQVRAYLEK